MEKHVESQQNTKALLMFNDRQLLSYEELLDLTSEIPPHQWCLNSLMTEVYKNLHGLLPDILNDVLAVLNTGTVLNTTTFL